MIAVSGLAKSFGPQTLFRDVAFQLNPGQRYGLVGANGSGKSTLLKVLTGEELPSGGTVSIPKRLRLGVLGLLTAALIGLDPGLTRSTWDAQGDAHTMDARASSRAPQ